jgi:hypothetical protein
VEDRIFDPILLAPAGMLFTLVILGWILWLTKIEHKQKMEKQRARLNGEVMAYVAEGSISPDDAERLLRAMNEPGADMKTMQDIVRLRASAAPAPDPAHAHA